MSVGSFLFQIDASIPKGDSFEVWGIGGSGVHIKWKEKTISQLDEHTKGPNKENCL